MVFLISANLTIAQNLGQIQRGQRGYTPPPRYNTKAFIELKDVEQELAIILPKCEAEFSLDAFQKEILKNILTKKIEDENAILSDDKNTRELRKSKIVARNNQFFVELGTILTPEQVTAFKNLNFTEASEEEKKEEKKKNKKKKRRKNKS